MSQTVGDYLIDRLHPWGVTRIYGYPGRPAITLVGKFAISMFNGDPRRSGVLEQPVEDMVSTLVPGR